MMNQFDQYVPSHIRLAKDLAIATKQGNLEQVRQLLNMRPRPDASLAVWHAIAHQNMDCLRALLQEGYFVEEPYHPAGNPTPYERFLIHAVVKQYLDGVQEILKYCPATIKTTYPLRRACIEDNEKLFDLLCPYFDLQQTHNDLLSIDHITAPSHNVLKLKSMLEKQNLLEGLDAKELSSIKKRM